jgi:hypothetical protein
VLTVDLVLSHYAEPLSYVLAFVARARAVLRDEAAREDGGAQLGRIFFVTHASDKALRSQFAGGDARVPADLNWTSVRVPNYGRESYAYLVWLERHLRDSAVAPHIWFSHAAPDPYMERTLWPRLPLLTRRTGMLGLAVLGGTSCAGSLDVALGPFLGALYFEHTGQFCLPSTGWMVMYNAEFIVSARRMRLLSPRLARRIRKLLELPDEHGIHVQDWHPPIPDGERFNSSRVSPILGYVVERMWNGARSTAALHEAHVRFIATVFFNCTTDVVDCNSDKPCTPGAAQCLDSGEFLTLPEHDV